MKTTIDTDLAIDASDEAKICLNCEKERCFSSNCKKYKEAMKAIRQARKLAKIK